MKINRVLTIALSSLLAASSVGVVSARTLTSDRYENVNHVTQTLVAERRDYASHAAIVEAAVKAEQSLMLKSDRTVTQREKSQAAKSQLASIQSETMQTSAEVHPIYFRRGNR